MTLCYNDSFVLNDPEQNVFESHVSWHNGLKDIAVTTHRQASADDGSLLFWASFFTTVKGRASSTTSPIRWEAYLPWLSHDPVSPVWGCSMHSQIIGKLGHCRFITVEIKYFDYLGVFPCSQQANIHEELCDPPTVNTVVIFCKFSRFPRTIISAVLRTTDRRAAPPGRA